MYLLRRAAARAIVQQPNRQLSTLRSPLCSRSAIFQSSKPTFCRSLHQSRIWRAEEDQKRPEGTRTAELAEDSAPVAEDAATITATSTAPEVEPAVQEIGEVVEGESSTTDAAETTAAAAAASTPSAGPPEPRQRSSEREYPGNRNDANPNRILYVGNLFFEVTPAQLEAEFGQFGTITNSRIVSDARGQSRGFGYIEFSEQSAAEQAIRQMDQKTFQGRRMAVQYHIGRERSTRERGPVAAKNAPSKTLFIGNMSFQMSDKDLNDLFRDVKDVLDVRVAIDRRSGQPRGFAHADFLDIQSAERAKDQLQSKVIYGRQLRVDFSASSSQVKTRDDRS